MASNNRRNPDNESSRKSGTNNNRERNLINNNRDRERSTNPDNKRRKKRSSNQYREEHKVVNYNPPININLGLVVFVVIFIYLCFLIVSYFKTEHITPYEVKMGSLAVNNTYLGVALRKEEKVESTYSGYVNYYAREGEKVSNGSMIYTIDSTGKLADMVSESGPDGNNLSEDDLFEIKNDMSLFSNSFDPHDFKDSYNFKYNIEGTVLKLENYKVLSGIDQINSANYSDAVSFGYAPKAGVLVYSTDGYEDLSPQELTPELMSNENYINNQYHSDDLIGEGDVAYKLITEENWSIVIEIDEERATELADESYVEVRFLRNNYKSWGKITILRQNGGVYLQLDFNNSMITFATERFIEIELLLNTQEGLKIPNSSIVERAFYLVPMEYYTEGGSQGNPGFVRECYLEDGTVSTEFVDADCYSLVDGYYYVDEGVFNVGDKLIEPDTTNTYTISKQDTLVGVYNINKGYADFKEITIVNQNEEYAIVKSNTEYGLNVYDHIVLKGDTVSDSDFIYE